MPITYGKRTGVTTMVRVVRHLCHLFLTFEVKITAWINASALSSSDKAICTAWIATTKVVCTLFNSIPDD